jgi:hypothetical protein
LEAVEDLDLNPRRRENMKYCIAFLNRQIDLLEVIKLGVNNLVMKVEIITISDPGCVIMRVRTSLISHHTETLHSYTVAVLHKRQKFFVFTSSP